MGSTGRKVLILALPLAFLLAFGARYFPPTEFPLSLAHVQIHEFGHAFAAWLSGRKATPLFIGWTSMSLDRSLFVFACFAFLIGVGIFKSCMHQAWFPAGVGVVLLIMQVYFTFRLDTDQFEVLVGWGGVGGEFWLGALLVIAFYFRMPQRLRWDFFRYPALWIGAYSFLHSYLLWHRIAHHQASVPWGSMWGGDSDAGGDMNRLVASGWTDDEIIRSYVRTGNWCLAAIALTYVSFIVKSCLRRASPPVIETGATLPAVIPQRIDSAPPLRPKLIQRVYVYAADAITGPLESSHLPRMLADGTIDLETPCCVEGAENWRTVRDFLQ